MKEGRSRGRHLSAQDRSPALDGPAGPGQAGAGGAPWLRTQWASKWKLGLRRTRPGGVCVPGGGGEVWTGGRRGDGLVGLNWLEKERGPGLGRPGTLGMENAPVGGWKASQPYSHSRRPFSVCLPWTLRSPRPPAGGPFWKASGL